MDRARRSACRGFHWNKRRNSLLGNKLTVVPVHCDTQESKCQTAERRSHVSSGGGLQREQKGGSLVLRRPEKCFITRRISFSLCCDTRNRTTFSVRCGQQLNPLPLDTSVELHVPLLGGPSVCSCAEGHCVKDTKFTDTGRVHPQALWETSQDH